MIKLWDFLKYQENMAVITDENVKITYGELYDLQKIFAQKMISRNLVGVIASNTLGSLIGYIGCLSNGMIPIMLPKDIKEEYFLFINQAYAPNYFWMPKKKRKIMGYHSIFRDYEYELWERDKKIDYKINNDLALLMPTSGSTGNSKLVKQSYQNILCNTKSICNFLKIDKIEKAITALPMSYTYGLSVINTHLFAGATILLTNRTVFQKSFWEFFQNHKGTSIAGVPYTYECLKRLGIAKMKLEHLHIMTQAGGKLSEELQQYFGEYAKETNKKFYIMYGQTEATARISYLPYEKCLEKLGSVGIAVPDSKLYLIDESNNVIQNSFKRGEVICRGEQVCLGYAKDYKDFEIADMNNGVLHTGDIGYMDEEGYLFITGRKNRIAKIFGIRIDLNDIEEVIWRELKKEVICIQKGERICLYTKEHHFKNLKEFLKRYVKISINIFDIERIENIPRKESGKIDYGKNKVIM